MFSAAFFFSWPKRIILRKIVKARVVSEIL